jgi:circadian clock protein KaiC
MKSDAAPISTGLPNLDYILGGGYAFNRTHLIEGRPGSGKTTLALQFLVDGRDSGEKCMFITISEGADELRRIATTHGLSLDGIDLFELVPPEHSLDSSQEQSIVYAGDLELGETIRLVMDSVRKNKPDRIIFGSFSEIRLLSQGALRYRRQILALEHFFASQVCTVLFLDNLTSADDVNLQSLAHGVIRLEQIAVPYGTERRRLRVTKMRGRAFYGGFHDFVIRRGGLVVFPRLVSGDYASAPLDDVPASSGIAELDALIGGGLDRGTTTLIRGPSGAGKSALALQFLSAALVRGEKALFISFDETRRNFERRADALAMPIRTSLANGQLTFMRIDPAELSPGEMADTIRNFVCDGVRAIVLDSLSGYQHAMPEENNLLLHLHELLTYLNQQGVLTILVLAHTMVDGMFSSPEYTTYLADMVLLVRQFEANGDIKRALSVLKKRTGAHERSIRELFFDAGGLRVGAPLTGFSALMSANPVYAGNNTFLVERSTGHKS